MAEEKQKNLYNPIVSVRRDFGEATDGPSCKYFRDDRGRIVTSDSDLKTICKIYREQIKPGTLFDLGCGPTHLHYMTALEDKLTHITALDLSEKNIKTLQEFLDFDTEVKTNYVLKKDLEVLKCTAEAFSEIREEKQQRSGEEILKSIKNKIYLENEKEYDLIVGNMHDIDKIKKLGNRKFDNIMIGYALFANTLEEIDELIKKIKNRLNINGKIIIADFKKFGNNIIEEEDEYREDDNVVDLYSEFYDFSTEDLIKLLEKNNFCNINIKEKDCESENIPGEKLVYFFISADNK